MVRRCAFVTGATGFAGSHLARRLAKDGWEVRALIRDLSRAYDLQKDGIAPIVGDLTHPETYAGCLREVDTVFHLAALYRSQGSRDDHFRVNADGTRHLIDAAIEHRIPHFVYCSTVGVHSAISGVADEQAPVRPADWYQESKWAGEQIVQERLDSGRIRGTIVRPVALYGPGDTRFLKVFRMVQAPVTFMPGSGQHLYHMIYIDDFIDAVLLCTSNTEAQGNVFILCGESPVSLNDLYGHVARALNKPLRLIHVPVFPFLCLAALCQTILPPLGISPPFYRRRLDFFLKSRAFTGAKARNVLGFIPKVTLHEGLKRTAEWYRQQNLIPA